MSYDNDWVHRVIDEEISDVPAKHRETPGSGMLEEYRQCLSLLEASRKQAPSNLAARVMDGLPGETKKHTWKERLMALWPTDGRWLGPSLAGALVAAVFAVGLNFSGNVGTDKIAPLAASPDQVIVKFEVHVPDANRVELIGSFNDWQQGKIILDGPDASGHWTASVALPSGHHEYFFLVNGNEWMTDPGAVAYRPDGFGRKNALIEL